MSWYQAADGREVWVPRDETVYTVIQPEQGVALHTEELMYLSMATNRPVFKEHLVEDDSWDTGRNKKKKLKFAGKERGFVIRVEHEEHQRVVPWFKAACKELLEREVCSKVDADEATNVKKQKKQYERGITLGVNECRIETRARCDHVAAGPGFKVEVACDQVKQNIMFFTHGRVMPSASWHRLLREAVESAYGRVFLARRVREEAENGEALGTGVQADRPCREIIVAPARRDDQHDEEEDWLATLMGVSDSDKSEGQQRDPPSLVAHPAEELEEGSGKVHPAESPQRLPDRQPTAEKQSDVSTTTGDTSKRHLVPRTHDSHAAHGGSDVDEERRFRDWEVSVREKAVAESVSKISTSEARPLMKLAHGSFKSLNFVTGSRRATDAKRTAKTGSPARNPQSPPSSDGEGLAVQDEYRQYGAPNDDNGSRDAVAADLDDGDDDFRDAAAIGVNDDGDGFRDTVLLGPDGEDVSDEDHAQAARDGSDNDWGWRSHTWASSAWQSSSWFYTQPKPGRTYGAPGQRQGKEASLVPMRTTSALWGLTLDDEDDGRPIVDIDDEEGVEQLTDDDPRHDFRHGLGSSAASRGWSHGTRWDLDASWGVDRRDSWSASASSSAQWRDGEHPTQERSLGW